MIVAIIQARLGSTRLPGKVLMKINGKSLLGYLIERLDRCHGLDKIIVAIPGADLGKIPLAVDQFCIWQDDDPNDVHRRFVQCILNKMPDTVIRICADSPLLDPALVDWMIEQHEGGITTNVKPRTFPAGQCIEIIDTDVFLAGKPGLDSDREHVMPFYYRTCPYKNVTNPLGDFSSHSMVVDTQEDFDRIKPAIEKMERPHWTYGWREIVEMMA